LLKKGHLAKDVREIYFNRGIIVVFLDICQKEKYAGDIECFLRLLRLLKIIARNNTLFYESKDSKNSVYSFIVTRFENFISNPDNKISITIIQKILQYLVDIAFELDFTMKEKNQQTLINEPNSLEIYYKVLIKCFEHMPEESNQNLKSYVLLPLESLSNSLMNDFTLSRIGIQDLLMKMLKLTNDANFLKELAACIGRISSTHTTPKQIQSILKHFGNSSKSVSQENREIYYLTLLDTLIDSISGEGIRNFYYFNGHDKSYIKLKAPLKFVTRGLFWTGNIRYERGNREKRQCIFSFLKTQPSKSKGIELFIQNKKLIYRLIKIYKENLTTSFTIPNVDLREDTWNHITMAHVGKDLIVYVNDSSVKIEIPMQAFSTNYNFATIGANMDLGTNQMSSFFFGEMSALYFFNATPKYQYVINDLALHGHYLSALYRTETPLSDSLPANHEQVIGKNPKYMNREFLINTNFILDPKVFFSIFNIKDTYI